MELYVEEHLAPMKHERNGLAVSLNISTSNKFYSQPVLILAIKIFLYVYQDVMITAR